MVTLTHIHMHIGGPHRVPVGSTPAEAEVSQIQWSADKARILGNCSPAGEEEAEIREFKIKKLFDYSQNKQTNKR